MAINKTSEIPHVPSTNDHVTRNDKIAGLRTQIVIDGKTPKITVKYSGRYGIGYDGCGTHTHK